MASAAGVPKVTFSSLNLMKSRHGLRPVAWLGEFAQGAGIDGVEYAPVWDWLPGHTVRALGKAVSSGSLQIRSFHANFRLNEEPRDDEQKLLVARLLDTPLGRLAMATTFTSTKLIGRMQQQLPSPVPVVGYPHPDVARDNMQTAQTGGRPLIQPTDLNARQIGAANLTDYDDRMRQLRHYAGYVIDTAHVRERFGQPQPGLISDIESSLPALAPYTEAVHWSAGRYDIINEPHIDTYKDLRTALSGDYAGTPTGDIFDALRDNGSRIGYIAIEAPHDAVAATTGYPKIGDLQKAYGDIAAGIRAYWG